MGEWEVVTLGEICKRSGGDIQTGPFGSQLHASDYVLTGIPSVMPQNIGDNRIDAAGIARVSDSDLARLRRYVLRDGDIVYSRRGNVELRALVRPENDGWLCGTGCLRARIVDRTYYDPRFISYALGLPMVRAWITRHAVGATMLNLNTKILAAVPITVPRVEVQQAIAATLGALDDMIIANERVAAFAFDLSHSLALDVICASAGPGRKRTPTVLSDIGQIFDGPHATPSRRDEGPHFLNITSLRSGRLDLSVSDHVSEEDFTKWTKRVTPQAEDLLFSYETRLGEAAIMPDGVRACLGRRMALIRPNRDRVDPYFLLHFYLSPGFQRLIAERTIHGATVPRIGLATMGDWKVDIPGLQEQLRIASQLRALHGRVVQAERESMVLARTRDELLPLLMSGKVTVEAAEELVGGVA